MHPWNIEFILITFDVFKFLKSTYFNDFKFWNKQSIFSIYDKSKCDKSIDMIFVLLSSLGAFKNCTNSVKGEEKYIVIFAPDSIINSSFGPIFFELSFW